MVEDYEEWAGMLAMRVRRHIPDAEVTICGTAQEALASMRAAPPDLAIVDVVLRGIGTGLDVAQDAVRRGVRTVLTSSHTDARVPGAEWHHKDGLVAALPSMLAAMLLP